MSQGVPPLRLPIIALLHLGPPAILALLIFLSPLQAAAATPETALGLWVQCEGPGKVFSSREKVERLIEQVTTSKFDTVYLQVYRGNRAYYESSQEEQGPWYANKATFGGRDPLDILLERLKGAGKRVIAWVNIFALAQNNSYRLLNKLGPAAIITDNFGKSLLQYPQLTGPTPGTEPGFWLDTPVHWLDPANLQVRASIKSTIEEILARYPSFDGLHLDFIRYPYAVPIAPGSRFSPRLDFGYGEESRQRFTLESGKQAPYVPQESMFTRLWNALRFWRNPGAPARSVDSAAWDSWRREQVTQTVLEFRTLLQAQNKGQILSAAVLCWSDRAYLSAMQDWRGWLDQRIIDEAVIMNYTLDHHLAGLISKQAMAFENETSKVAIGLGAYLFSTRPAELLSQVRKVREAGAKRLVFFSYDQLADQPEFWKMAERDFSEEQAGQPDQEF